MATSDERHLGFLISDSARLLRTVFDRRVRDMGLTRSQWLVLRRLGRRPGVSQSELAIMLEVEKPTAGRLIDRLEENGWVERRPDAEDRRVNRVYMTAAGKAVNDAIAPISEQMVEEALAGLSKSERAAFTDLLIGVKSRLLAMANGDAEETGSHHGSREPALEEA